MKKRILFICGLTAVEGGGVFSSSGVSGGEVDAAETTVRSLYSLKLFHEKLEARRAKEKSLEDKEFAERVGEKLTKQDYEELAKDNSLEDKKFAERLREALTEQDYEELEARREKSLEDKKFAELVREKLTKHVSELYDCSTERFKELEATDLNAADEKSLPGVGALKVALDSAEKASLEDLQSAVNRLLAISWATRWPKPEEFEFAKLSLFDALSSGEAVNSPTPAGPLYWALIFAHYHKDFSGLKISKCMAAIRKHYNSWSPKTESLSCLSRPTDYAMALLLSDNSWIHALSPNVGKFDEITDQPTASRRFGLRPTRNKLKVSAAAAGQKLRSGRPRQNMKRLHRGRNSKRAAKQTRRQ